MYWCIDYRKLDHGCHNSVFKISSRHQCTCIFITQDDYFSDNDFYEDDDNSFSGNNFFEFDENFFSGNDFFEFDDDIFSGNNSLENDYGDEIVEVEHNEACFCDTDRCIVTSDNSGGNSLDLDFSIAVVTTLLSATFVMKIA